MQKMANLSDLGALFQSLKQNKKFQQQSVEHMAEKLDQSPGGDTSAPSDQPARTVAQKPPPPRVKPKPKKEVVLQSLMADSNRSTDTTSAAPQLLKPEMSTIDEPVDAASAVSAKLPEMPDKRNVQQMNDKSNNVVCERWNDSLLGNTSSPTSAHAAVLPLPADVAAGSHPVTTTVTNDNNMPVFPATRTSGNDQLQMMAKAATAADADKAKCGSAIWLPAAPPADSAQTIGSVLKQTDVNESSANHQSSVGIQDDAVQAAHHLIADVGTPTVVDLQKAALSSVSRVVSDLSTKVAKMAPSSSRSHSLPRNMTPAYDQREKKDVTAIKIPPPPAFRLPTHRSKVALGLCAESKSKYQHTKEKRCMNADSLHDISVLGRQPQSTANHAQLLQLSGTPLAYDWQFQDNVGSWQAYDYELAIMLERMYLVDPNSSAQFGSDMHRYTVDFSAMQQINEKTNKKRPVRRIDNPNFKSENGEGDSTTGETTAELDEFTRRVATFIPETWETDANTIYSGYQLVDVSKSGETSQEYNEIAELFRKTTPHKQLQSIKRVENRNLYIAFYLHKTQVEGERGKKVEVRRLFHGTRGQYIDAICRRGFDFRLHGSTTGCIYGRGSYFARDAKYSLGYSDCGKILVVQVIVGDYALGDSKMYRPPPRDPSNPLGDLYDSCVDDVSNPSIFVIFERWQSYPEYLLEYT